MVIYRVHASGHAVYDTDNLIAAMLHAEQMYRRLQEAPERELRWALELVGREHRLRLREADDDEWTGVSIAPVVTS